MSTFLGEDQWQEAVPLRSATFSHRLCEALVLKEYGLATSFISEHSAEFSLVPYMKNQLEKEFDCVVPMFPWLSRELGKMSKSVHDSDNFHILTLFPRRPKVDENGNIFITINHELSQVKEIGKNKGGTVLAGCPLATNFWELA